MQAIAREDERKATPFSTVIEQLTPEKRKLLALRNPLSFSQQRLWFIDRLTPGTEMYNVPGAIKLTGILEIGVLERSLSGVLRRHEVLRTVYASLDGTPLQLVVPELDLGIGLVDLSVLSVEHREREADRIAREEARLPFDLERGPIIRAKVAKLTQSEHVLMLTIHHIASDGWSMGLLISEIATLYDSSLRTHAARLPELTIQYLDYARWQRKRLRGEELAQQESFWRNELEGVPAMLTLPTDNQPDKYSAEQSGRREIVIQGVNLMRLRELCQQEGVTLFMVLLAAYEILLMRYTGQEQMLIGVPVAGRNRVELESLIGLFVNTVVIKGDLRGEPSFRQLLRRVKETAISAYAHQEMPFEKLVEVMQPERSLSREPLVQVLFDLQKPMMREGTIELLQMGDIATRPMDVGGAQVRFDLVLSLVEEEERLVGKIDYRADLFEGETIRRLTSHFEKLLEEAVRDIDQKVTEIVFMSEDQRRQLLVDWNDTGKEFGRAECIHRLFEEQAERLSDATALICEDKQITYGEINRRANCLAHYLISLGVGPEVPVIIFVERSAEMIVGLLGVLKAGGAYVPLSRVTPGERLAVIIDDLQAPVVLTQTRLAGRLPAVGVKTVCMDSEWERISLERDDNPTVEVTGQNLAYLIYTSGSTGTPKAVTIEHRSLVNFIDSASDVYGTTLQDRILQFADISFDTAAEEVFMCLTRGATLVLRTDSTPISGLDFLQWCKAMDLTVLDLPTAFWHELMAEGSAIDWKLAERLRLVIIGGEMALAERVREWHKRVGGGVRLMNSYGPTETTIASTLYQVPEPSGPDGPMHSVPIGRPIANLQMFVLDRRLRPVPVGVAGELYIGGDGLARGYWRRPGLTAEKFIPDPFGNQPGLRLYRSGDRVRYLSDGNIEYLSRMDDQVKVRGYRVELGEIEAVLSAHPSVTAAVVVAREYQPGETRLVAYVASLTGDITPSKMKSYTREKLPEYMVPYAFVVMKSLPLTSSGKPDRRALPTAMADDEREAEYVVPGTEMEEELANIWKEVLGVERVSVEDNFFDLGGHSLLVIRVHEQLQRRLRVQISLLKLFEHPTVRKLAGYLAEGNDTTAEQSREWADKRRQALKRRREIARSMP